jgi:hypothetical protein
LDTLDTSRPDAGRREVVAMRTGKTVIVRLPADEYEELLAVAEAEERDPPRQVAYLIRRDLAARRARADTAVAVADGTA